MNIASIKYSSEDRTSIVITLSDGSKLHSSYPSVTWHRKFIVAFELANGIEDFITLEDAVNIAEVARVEAINAETKERELLLIPGVDELRIAAESAKNNGDSLEKFKVDAEKIKPVK